MKRLNPTYIQLIGDSVIPLLGYFFSKTPKVIKSNAPQSISPKNYSFY